VKIPKTTRNTYVPHLWTRWIQSYPATVSANATTAMMTTESDRSSPVTAASAVPPMIVLKMLKPTKRKTAIACGTSAPRNPN
jgi:hypothetical protein